MNDSRRRLWVNGGLVVVAGVAALAVVLTQTLWTSAEREARSSHLVVGFRTDDVDRVVLVQGGKRVVIEREIPSPQVPVSHELDDQGYSSHSHTRFRVTEPFQGEAEEVTVDGLLRAIELATAIRHVDEVTFDRAAAGLDEPEQTLELSMGDVEVRLRLGKEAHSPAGARYIEVAGQGVANKGVYVVSRSTALDLNVAPEAFRIKQLVPYMGSALSRVLLRRTGEAPLELTYDKPRDSWRVNHGQRSVRVSQVAWERLFAAFSRSQLERVLESGVELDPNARVVEVELTPRDNKLPGTKLAFGGKCPGEPELEVATRLAPEPVTGCTRALHLDTFINQPESLLDDRLLSLRADEIEEVRITRGDKALELARRDAAWVMRRPQEGTVERDVGQAFLQTLTTLRGDLVEPPTNTQTDIAVVVTTGGDTPDAVRQQSFEVTAQTSGGTFVHRLDDDVWLRVGAGVSQQLVPFDLLLRKSNLTDFEPKELHTVTLTTPSWQQRFVVTEQGKGCDLQAPVGYDAEPTLCLDVIDGLRSLRAQSWVSDSRQGQWGFDAPTVFVEWRLNGVGKDVNTQADGEDGSVLHSLVVGGLAKGGGYYASLDDGPVFTLSQRLVETFTTLVVSRAAFALDPEAVQRVVVRASGRKVELVRLGDEFICKPDADNGVALDAQQVRALIDALALIKPEAAVELPKGPAPAQMGFAQPLLEVETSHRTLDGSLRTSHYRVGIGDVYRDVNVYYAEPIVDEANAVFVLPRASVRRVLEALDGVAP
jgi:hypothetical protein